MTSTTTDQITGFSGSLAVKQPVRLATTAPIVLEGLFAIDGVVPAEGDRILVKDQADASQNGIYIASSGVWSRAVDFDATGKVAKGTMTLVGDGPQVGLWMVTTADPVVLGLSGLSFGKVFTSDALGAMISGAIAKATPVDADLLGMADSADGDASKKTTFLQVWANYFKGKADALYQPVKTILTTLGNLADGSGALTNNGSGTLSWGAAGGFAYYSRQQPTSDVTEVVFTGLSGCRYVKFAAAFSNNSTTASYKFQARTSGGTWRDISPAFAAIYGTAVANGVHIDVYDFNQSADGKIVHGGRQQLNVALDASDATNSMSFVSGTDAETFSAMPSWNEVWDEIKLITSVANAIEGSTADQRGNFICMGMQ